MKNKQQKEKPSLFQLKRPPPIFLSQFQQRKWLTKHGRDQYIPFKDDQILVLRKYFAELDQNGSGSIGVRELQDPLIALGLSQNREQVEKMIQDVDQDNSGKIEFDQFLSIIAKASNKKNTDSQPKSAIHDFFKKMSQGQVSEEMDQHLPFKLNVSQYRRKKILQAIKGPTENKQKAIKILHAFKKQVTLMQSSGQLNGLDSIQNQQSSSLGLIKYTRILPEIDKMQKPTLNLNNYKIM